MKRLICVISLILLSFAEGRDEGKTFFLPTTPEELDEQLEMFDGDDEQMELLAEFVFDFQSRMDIGKEWIVGDGGPEYRPMPESQKQHYQEMIKLYEARIVKLGGRPGEWLKFPLVWDIEGYEHHEGRMEKSGVLKQWLDWLLKSLSQRKDKSERFREPWHFKERLIRQGRLQALKNGSKGNELLWGALDIADDFIEFLERQKACLPDIQDDEARQSRLPVTRNADVQPIPEGVLLKLQVPAGLDKLKALFADLEQQRMVASGATEMLEDHFTESARGEAVPEDSSPIEWKEKKYEAVYLLRKLRAVYPPWLKATDAEISKHFIHSDKKPINPARFGIKIGTDDLSRIDEIVDAHLK